MCMLLAHGSREWNSIYQVLPQWCKDSRLIDIPSLCGQDTGCGPVHSGGTGLWKGNLVFSFLKMVIFSFFLSFSYFFQGSLFNFFHYLCFFVYLNVIYQVQYFSLFQLLSFYFTVELHLYY